MHSDVTGNQSVLSRFNRGLLLSAHTQRHRFLKAGAHSVQPWDNFLPIAKAGLVQKPSSSTPSMQGTKTAGTVFHDFWEHMERWLKGPDEVGGVGGREARGPNRDWETQPVVAKDELQCPWWVKQAAPHTEKMRAAHLCLLRDIYKAWIPWSNTDESVCGGGAGCRVGCEGKGHMRSGSSTRLHTQTTPRHTVSEPTQLINKEMSALQLAEGSASQGILDSQQGRGLASEDCCSKKQRQTGAQMSSLLLPSYKLEHAGHLQSILSEWNMSSGVRKRHPSL